MKGYVQNKKLSFVIIVIIVIFWSRQAEDGEKRAEKDESLQCDILQGKCAELRQNERKITQVGW